MCGWVSCVFLLLPLFIQLSPSITLYWPQPLFFSFLLLLMLMTMFSYFMVVTGILLTCFFSFFFVYVSQLCSPHDFYQHSSKLLEFLLFFSFFSTIHFFHILYLILSSCCFFFFFLYSLVSHLSYLLFALLCELEIIIIFFINVKRNGEVFSLRKKREKEKKREVK
ncbi:T. brucei spp.-specific protein [Trypanosoma brucei gambiense DAL972]|uniref:T. brucei spp.-specific protein n=1 Tax=Trypanosoma brucei gambiense (strain MHOM/CI/86/DAL972) TaxID=679716 RepID=C9ZJ06_TRYB9|nr:T. brucei spp.-specific protein [Trypanosoma brucei gambiense DAL972]CBH09364.1 T. brucei spp.-specific protein [Trypanosoma brucei gambiense DAL972]|eukprot:XP_011771670.1 T. brucei spp.-specific protein [Trypanosoma brucei gambiense DAL972]